MTMNHFQGTRLAEKYNPEEVEVGYVIGNGVSRQGFDLESLRGRGPVFGCNALYRDFAPDVLCAMDHGVLLELSNVGYAGVTAKLNKTQKQAVLDNTYLEKLVVPRGNGVAWYTGIFATWLLSSLFPNLGKVFLLGFDLYDAKTNNVYKNSLNYEKMGMNNKLQFENFKELIFKKFSDVIYYRVVENEEESVLPDEWILLENIRNIDYEGFKLIS